jgi:hypothetical protein
MKTFGRGAVFFACVLALAPHLAGMSPPAQKFVGSVRIFGSEPHTYVGIRDEKDGKVYIPDTLENEAALRELQGLRIEFTVKFSERNTFPPADGAVTVISYRILN